MGGQPQSSIPAPGGFSFGSSATPASATPGGFSFGQNPGSVSQATPSTQPNAPASTGTQLGGLAGFAMGKMPSASLGTPAAAPVGASAAPTGTTGLTLGATPGTGMEMDMNFIYLILELLLFRFDLSNDIFTCKLHGINQLKNNAAFSQNLKMVQQPLS